MSGRWIYVCGPSGAGKDSVIAFARDALRQRTDLVFTRRLITRPAHPGSDHEPVDDRRFDALLAGGGLAMHWSAHGVRYGVPAHHSDQVASGCLVVVNGSRAHLASLAPDEQRRVVLVTTDAQCLQARIEARGRDSPADLASRLARNACATEPAADCILHNAGSLAQTGAQWVAWLEAECLRVRPLAPGDSAGSAAPTAGRGTR